MTQEPGKVNLFVTPLRRSGAIRQDAWLWDVTAEETVSGKRHSVGRVTSTASTASHSAKALAARERPDFTVLAVIVEPTIGLQS